MEELKAYLNNITPVEDDMFSEYISFWTAIEFPKKEIITTAGQVEPYLYFVVEGVQKLYYLDEKKEHIVTFAYAPSFSGIIESFLNQTPSIHYLETISKSKLIRISYDDHNALIAKHRALETLFRIITQKYLLGAVNRYHELMAFDTEKRFKVFMNRSAHLLNKIPQKDIAYYLRIDPTNFSKLMNSVKI